MKLLIFLISFLLAGSACSTATTPDSANLAQREANAASAQTSPSPVAFEVVTSEAVFAAFKNAEIPVTDEIIYSAETDPNHLLGRPNQYVGKINFSDERSVKKAGQKRGNTIEVFQNAEDLEKRKTYTEAISKGGGMFNQYIYVHKNVLLRLEHQLLPAEASEYERILKSL